METEQAESATVETKSQALLSFERNLEGVMHSMKLSGQELSSLREDLQRMHDEVAITYGKAIRQGL